MKFAQCHYMMFSSSKIDWHLQRTGRMCCIHNKSSKKNAQALLYWFHLHALTSLNLIWELHWLRAAYIG